MRNMNKEAPMRTKTVKRTHPYTKDLENNANNHSFEIIEQEDDSL